MHQACQNGCPTVKFTVRTSVSSSVWTSTRVRVYIADAFLYADEFLPSAPTTINASAGKIPSAWTLPVRADASYIRTGGRSRGRSKINKIKIKIFFLVVVAGWKREKNNFGFRFSIPKIPEFPELREKKKVFRPSSPSHPSKLYSSLGWLNSKVPKPFFPFSLRLIDVDGF
jgi:hypothetical protein